MPCQHKSYQDLDLSYANWEVETLFIGTFNPGWDCPNNYSQWFYGRIQRNEFWSILPSLHNHRSLIGSTKQQWLEFCREYRIGITDMIRCFNTADETLHWNVICSSRFRDEVLEQAFSVQDCTFTDIVGILQRRPSIKRVCITRKNITGLWKAAIAPVKQYCSRNHIVYLPLRSPSRGARNGTAGRNFSEAIADAWAEAGYPDYRIKTKP